MSSSFQPVQCFFLVCHNPTSPKGPPSSPRPSGQNQLLLYLKVRKRPKRTSAGKTQQACCFGWWDAIIFCVFFFRLFIVELKLHSVYVRLENIFHPYKIKSGKKNTAGLHGGWYAPPSSCVTACIYFKCMRIISIEHMCKCVCVCGICSMFCINMKYLTLSMAQ